MRTYRFAFTEPTLFLASPGDVRYLRNVARGVIAEVLQGYPQVDGLRVFAWEHETAATPFDDLAPAQEQIPPPNDPQCRGILAFFGEWIGRPLAADFPLDALAPLERRLRSGTYQLVHPWRPEAADFGGFPLTGSTFEVLSALATHRRAGEDGSMRPLPLFLRFVGSREVLDELDVGRARWGNRRLRKQVHVEHENDDEEQIRRGRLIRQQLIQLRNFALFLENELGHVINFVGDEEEAAEQLKFWLEHDLALAPIVPDRDQFKGLDFYDVEDTGVFYGRENDSKLALRALRALWETPNAPKWYWVRGVSGAGKSSFLRAGVIGHLVKRSHEREAYAHCVFRPAELVPGDRIDARRSAHGPLRALFELSLTRVIGDSDRDRIVASRLGDFDVVAETEQAAWAARVLAEHLASGDEATGDTGTARRLLLGLDQFEDIVDALHDAHTGGQWDPVVEFAVRSSEQPGILVLATIREDRISAMLNVPRLLGLHRQTERSRSFLDLPSRSDLEQVIRRPFETIRGLALSDDLVSSLSDRLQAFIDRSAHGKARPSLLPLVSLTLERLYREVAVPLVQEHRGQGAAGASSDTTPVGQRGAVASAFERAAEDAASTKGPVMLSAERAGTYLEIERAISALAEEAVEETKKTAGPNWEDATIGMLFRRLIAWTGTSEQLFNLPAADWPHDEAVAALARAMKSRRLIIGEEGNRIRLVHEAVVTNWPPAQAWLEYERPLLRQINPLLSLSAEWRDPALADRVVDAGTILYVPQAARLLSVWFDILERLPRAPDPDGRAALRDFCLALIDRHNRPGEIVEESPRQPSHLHLATQYQRADIVRRMLATAPEAVSARRKDARTALFFPAFQGNREIVDLLLAHGADPDAADEQQWRPIHAASMTGSLDVVVRLADAGAKLDSAGAPGGTAPIHVAAGSNRTEILDYFVRTHKVAADLRDEAGLTALMRAASANHAPAIRTLVALAADPHTTVQHGTDNDIGWTALHLAARDGGPDAIDALLDTGLDVNRPLVNGATPLHLAAHNGRLDCIRRLVARGAALEAGALNRWNQGAKAIRSALDARQQKSPHTGNGEFDLTPIHMAVTAGHLETAALLVGAGALLNSQTGSGATALHLAATHNRAEMASLLVERGADPERRDAHGRTPFHEALEKRAFQAARALLDAGASREAVVDLPRRTTAHGDILQVTPLQKAAGDGSEDVLLFLLAQNVEVGAADSRGWTALHYAAAGGHAKSVGWLLARGANAQARDESGLTALHLACRSDHPSVVSALLSHPLADWNAEGSAPTPLHLAAHAGAVRIMADLIAAGHPVDARDADGWTPLHCAAQAGSSDALDILLAAGADARLVAERPGLGTLQFAARTGDVASLRRLLTNPFVSADQAPAGTPTPVVLAMRYRQFDAVVVLIEAGAAVDAEDPESGLGLGDAYRRHVSRTAGGGRTDGRHPALEGVLEQQGIKVGRVEGVVEEGPLPARQDLPWTMPAPTLPTSGGRAEFQPGATAFLPDLNRAATSPWTAVKGSELQGFLAQVSPVDGKYTLTSEDTEVHWRLLPWYERVALIHVSSPELRAKGTRLFYLTDDGNLFRLNGVSPPIHEVNAKAPIKLNDRNVLDYLRFFCFFVRGEEGPFYLAEAMDDALLPQRMEPTAMSILSGSARPATLVGTNEKGHYLCEALVFYSNAIFVANFAVHPTGMLEMLDDEPIAADLPGRVSITLS